MKEGDFVVQVLLTLTRKIAPPFWLVSSTLYFYVLMADLRAKRNPSAQNS